MRDPAPRPGVPGARLLQLARVVFDEAIVDAVVRPTIADLQREVDAAGADGRRRIVARWRGYRAFWTLVLVAPFGFWGVPMRGRARVAFPDLAARVAVTLIVLTVATLNQSALGLWTAVVAIGGTAFAVGIHSWYGRHPLLSAEPDAALRRPEINMSAIPVGADIGGMMFVLGSMFAVLAGLPMVRWFLCAALVLGGFVAWALMAVHASHPLGRLPERRIVPR